MPVESIADTIIKNVAWVCVGLIGGIIALVSGLILIGNWVGRRKDEEDN